MSSIIRLNTTFNNAKLKTLQDYNTDTLKQQILSLPTLRAFYDATDKATMTMSGNLVTHLNDLSENKLHFVQSDLANAPSYDEQAFGHVGGLKFMGGQVMKSRGLLSGKTTGTVVIFAKGDSNTLNVLISSAKSTVPTIYTRENSAGALSGTVVCRETDVHIKPTQLALSYDNTKQTAQLNTNEQYNANTSGNVAITANDVNLGAWADGRAERYIGKIGHVMFFDEDLSKNQAVFDLVQEYAKRKYRI